MAGLPTKKITALSPVTSPLTGFEQLECVQLGNSHKLVTRDLVLPTDSLFTFSAMGGSLPGSRQLTLGIGLGFVDGGPGSTYQIFATGAVAGPANPTGTVGLAAVNGVALTYMRSDAAPPLSQAIVPTWSGLHTFTAGLLAAANDPFIRLSESDAAANNRVWDFTAVGEQFQGRVGNDALGAFVNWLQVDRTLNVIDSVNLLATTVQVNGQNIRDAAILTSGTVATARLGSGTANNTTWLRGDQTWQTLPGSFTGFDNPTASVGLTVVNGAATTAMRSDGAPALSQAIAPTWTAQHIFGLSGATNAAVFVSSVQPQTDYNETDGAANNRRWRWEAQGEAFLGRTVNDANSAAVTWIAVDRTLNVVDSIALTSTALTWNGNPISTAVGANPTGTIGLTAVNGAATTFLRSDGAPALSQAIAPTWTAQHIFSLDGATNAAILLSSARPQVDWNETDGAANNRRWRWEAQAEQFIGAVVNDANSAAVSWLVVDRTLNVVDSVTFPIGAAIFRGGVTGATTTQVQVGTRASTPSVIMTNGTPAADTRNWETFVNTAGTFAIRALNDAASASTDAVVITRTTSTVTSISLPTATSGAFLVGAGGSVIANRVSQFNGAALVSVLAYNTSANPQLELWTSLTAGNNSFVEFFTEAAATIRGSITYNRGGGLVVYNTTSDERLKKNIQDSPDSGPILDAIQVRSFDWKETGNHVDHWVVAQELNEVFPFAVTKGIKGGLWSVDPSKLVPLMVKEIQSLRSRIKSLELN